MKSASNNKTALYIMTRDLRAQDNSCLGYCIDNGIKSVIPIFLLNKQQTDSEKNKYFSINSISFMMKTLGEIYKALNLSIITFSGRPEDYSELITKITKKMGISHLIISKDYTPFAKNREQILESICKKIGISFVSVDDYILIPEIPDKPYKKFTPFYTRVIENIGDLRKPDSRNPFDYIKFVKYVNEDFKFPEYIDLGYPVLMSSGSGAPVSKIKVFGMTVKIKIDKSLDKNYDTNRDFLWGNISNTKLSRYVKFGAVSVRHLFFETFRNSPGLRRSLLWRDFYYSYYAKNHRAFNYGDNEFVKKKVSWVSGKKEQLYFDAWSKGKTGIPVVDASIRELLHTGYMHNRGRLITASFLTKNLRVNWKLGERFFANHLYDYDPVINCGNWSNIASVAIHSTPYFRIMNPWIQSEKYDKNCEYIKKWIPELSEVPNDDIHNWGESYKKYISRTKYPQPIVDYQKTKEEYLKFFEK